MKEIFCMKPLRFRLLTTFVLLILSSLTYAQVASYTLKGSVHDEKGRPVELAQVVLNDALNTNTDRNGNFVINNVPAGVYQYHVTFVGYQAVKGTIEIKTGKEVLNVRMQELGLKLKGVTVTATQQQMGSKSEIGQEAIRHLQPKSLSDMLQLVPGNLTENPNLNNLSQAHIREIGTDRNNALGTSVVVDGTPLSNDANLQVIAPTRYGTASSATMDGMSEQTTAGGGVDLRTVSAGNIETVEVIRGIPGVEYGNLTSGVVIVKTKSGRTPWETKVQADPYSKLIYAGKGFQLKDGGAINFSLDWAQSWGDTRRHYLGYDRVTANAGYSNQWGPLSFNLKGAFYSNVNNRKRDPQMDELGDTFKNTNVGLRLSANGSWKPKNAWITSLDYNLSMQASHTIDKHHDRVTSPDGVITNVRETGVHEAMFKNAAYDCDYKIDGKPFNFFAQLIASKYFQLGKQNYTNVKLGAEYTVDDNNGNGLTYDINNPPQAGGTHTLRPRAYKDIPALNTLSGFLGDKTRLFFGTRDITLEAGVRLTNLFLDKDKSGGNGSMTVLEPRINASLNLLNRKNNNLFDDFSITGGFGLSNKMPTLLYLYPDKSYFDYPSLAYYGNTEADRLALIETRVVENTQNANLKPTNTRKWEIGFNFRIGKVKGFLTYFNEHHKHEFGFDSQLLLMHTTKYLVPTGSTDLTFDQATGAVSYYNNGVAGTATTTERNEILTWAMPSNQSRSWKHGIEYGLDFGEFKPIRTSLSINGAWFHINRRYEKDQLSIIEKDFDYAAIMPAGSGTIQDRINTTFRFITHIPAIKMIFTTTVQVVWYQSTQACYTDNDGNNLYSTITYQGKQYYAVNPIGYYNRNGNYTAWTADAANSATLFRMVDRYQMYAFKKDVVDPWAMLNFRFTKELGRVGELSFIANNFLNTSKWHTNKYSLAKSQLYPDIYFGAELKLKF